jgi:hypothetical protein
MQAEEKIQKFIIDILKANLRRSQWGQGRVLVEQPASGAGLKEVHGSAA